MWEAGRRGGKAPLVAQGEISEESRGCRLLEAKVHRRGSQKQNVSYSLRRMAASQKLSLLVLCFGLHSVPSSILVLPGTSE